MGQSGTRWLAIRQQEKPETWWQNRPVPSWVGHRAAVPLSGALWALSRSRNLEDVTIQQSSPATSEGGGYPSRVRRKPSFLCWYFYSVAGIRVRTTSAETLPRALHQDGGVGGLSSHCPHLKESSLKVTGATPPAVPGSCWHAGHYLVCLLLPKTNEQSFIEKTKFYLTSLVSFPSSLWR